MKSRLPASLLSLLMIEACKLKATPVSVEIVEAGASNAMKVQTVDKMDAPRTAEGAVGKVRRPTIFPGGTDLCAQIGTSFGVRVLVHASNAPLLVPLVTRVSHPPITDPDTSKQTTVDEWDSPLDIGTPRYTGWAFEKPTELVPGRWRIDIVREGAVVAGRDFTIRLCPDPWLNR